MSTTTVDVTTAIDRYIAAWNETDPVRRRGLIADVFTSDASYLDPMLTGEGHNGLDAMIAAAQEQFTGYEIRLAGSVDNHHDRVRFTWEMVEPEGDEPIIIGVDFGLLAPDGR